MDRLCLVGRPILAAADLLGWPFPSNPTSILVVRENDAGGKNAMHGFHGMWVGGVWRGDYSLGAPLEEGVDHDPDRGDRP